MIEHVIKNQEIRPHQEKEQKYSAIDSRFLLTSNPDTSAIHSRSSFSIYQGAQAEMKLIATPKKQPVRIEMIKSKFNNSFIEKTLWTFE